jgi:hypothetical protein
MKRRERQESIGEDELDIAVAEYGTAKPSAGRELRAANPAFLASN